MASKTGQAEPAKLELEELLDYVDKTLDRVKVLYEQYFLGMQKQPPTHLHGDVERRLRDLMQVQIRNTGLRYRFATLQQKFGSYNSYWRRTLRQIESGTYIRNLAKISRRAAQSGEEIPEEILAAMPKRMRDQVKRDREQAIAIARRRERTESDVDGGDEPAMISEAHEVERAVRKPQGPHVLSEADADVDFDAFFASMGDDTQETAAYVDPAPARAAPPPPPAPAQPANIRAAGIGVGRTSSPRLPAIPPRAQTQPGAPAPSQVTRPLPVAPGSSTARAPVSVQTMSGPFPRAPTPPPVPPGPPRRDTPRPGANRPPPGMNDADVNALYATYVKAKEMVGQNAGPGAYGKLLKTINAQAPRIMEQYKAKGVEFSVVVKDNQVIIKAKPKT